MDVRHADDQDRLAVVQLLKESHASAGMPFRFQAARAEALFKSHISNPDYCCFVIGRPAVGTLMASCFDHPYGAGRIARETVWFIRPSSRGRSAIRMLEAYEKWAMERGCALVSMAASPSKQAGALYERRGYSPVETHFMKALRTTA